MQPAVIARGTVHRLRLTARATIYRYLSLYGCADWVPGSPLLANPRWRDLLVGHVESGTP